MKLFGRKKQQATGNQPLLSPVAGADTLVAAGAGGKGKNFLSRLGDRFRSAGEVACQAILAELARVPANRLPNATETATITRTFDANINKLRIQDIHRIFTEIQTGSRRGRFEAHNNILGFISHGKTALYWHIIHGLQDRAMEKFTTKHIDTTEHALSHTGTYEGYKLANSSGEHAGRLFKVTPAATLSRFGDLMTLRQSRLLCCTLAERPSQRSYREHLNKTKHLDIVRHFGADPASVVPSLR